MLDKKQHSRSDLRLFVELIECNTHHHTQCGVHAWLHTQQVLLRVQQKVFHGELPASLCYQPSALLLLSKVDLHSLGPPVPMHVQRHLLPSVQVCDCCLALAADELQLLLNLHTAALL